MFCTKCGAKIEEGTNFCNECGNPLVPQISMNINVHEPKKSSRSSVKIIGIVACAFICIFMIFKMFDSNKPIDVVQDFIGAMNDKDINKAVTYLDPQYERLYKASSKLISGLLGTPDITNLAEIVPGLTELAGVKNDSQITIEKVVSQNVNGNTASIRVILKFKEKDPNGKTQYDTSEAVFTLKKFSNKWKIVNLQ